MNTQWVFFVQFLFSGELSESSLIHDLSNTEFSNMIPRIRTVLISLRDPDRWATLAFTACHPAGQPASLPAGQPTGLQPLIRNGVDLSSTV